MKRLFVLVGDHVQVEAERLLVISSISNGTISIIKHGSVDHVRFAELPSGYEWESPDTLQGLPWCWIAEVSSD